jgi:enoyl-CoA hydratase
MSPVLASDDVDAVRILTLNRPGARNALSGDLIRDLYDALRAADSDPAVRAVVLTGSDPAFCAGVDLKEAARDGQAYFDLYETHDCIGQVAQMSTPVIGAINGAAFTGGLEIALGCDFLIGSERAALADTHVRVGVLPGGGMTVRLPMFVGESYARRMSMTGEIIGAEQALRIGLLTEVVPHADLLPRAVELGQRIAEVDPRMMLGIKRMYVGGAASHVDPALDVQARVAGENPPAYEEIEQRRLEVMARNRAALDVG